MEYCKVYSIHKGPFQILRASLITTPIPVPPSTPIEKHKTVHSLVLVPYNSKPDGWGDWRVKSPQPVPNSSNNPLPEDVEEPASEVFE